MDICVLNQFFYPYKGGTEKVLLEVCRRLSKGNNVTVITSAGPGRGGGTGYVEGIKVVRLRSSHICIPAAPLPFVSMEGLNDAIIDAHCEIYHINNRYQYFWDSVAAIRRAGGRIALTVHNALPMGIDPVVDTLGLAYDELWGRRLMHEADLITGISRSAIETTVPKRELKKTYLVYNGVDYRLFRPEGKSSRSVRGAARKFGEVFESNDANVITNGRLTPQKGQKYLIDAVSALAKEGRKVGVLIIGRGPLRQRLYSEARAQGLGGRFWIKTGIDESALPHYYNACDLFALPSLYEPAGVAVLEALACAMPSIGSNVGGIPEMMGGHGLYFEPRDSEALKDRIGYALDNGKKMRAMASGGRKLVMKRHDWDRIAKRYEQLFLNTLHH